MKRRYFGLGFAALGVLLVSGFISGCGSSSEAEARNTGTLNLPLVNNGASGTTYRLRNATFEIERIYSYAGGYAGAPSDTSVSSEENPDASAISVSLDAGSYDVALLPGWHLEKKVGSSYEPVEATLLSSATQYVYVAPHAATTAEYQFGIGGRSVWFNGDLNIQIHVYENPSEIYGGGAGAAGAAGAVDAPPGYDGSTGGQTF